MTYGQRKMEILKPILKLKSKPILTGWIRKSAPKKEASMAAANVDDDIQVDSIGLSFLYKPLDVGLICMIR